MKHKASLEGSSLQSLPTKQVNITLPEIVDIFITGRCDMDCPMCYGAHVPEGKNENGYYYSPSVETIAITGSKLARQELSVEELKVIIDQIHRLGIPNINIGGGEPLLRKETPEIISYANGVGLSVYLSSNGTYTLHHYDKIKDKLSTLGLSLDGSTVETNVAMGRKFYFLNNILSILEHFKVNKPSHKVKVGTVVTQINFDDIEKIGELLFENNNLYKPDVRRIYQYEAVERGYVNRKANQIPDDDFNNLVKYLKNRFPGVNISARTNSNHNNAYFFISPDGMLQTVNENSHISILDLRAATTEEVYQTLLLNKETLLKNIQNRKWL